MDAGASESGAQMTTIATKGAETKAATFTLLDDTTVVSADFSRALQPGEGEGWLARREFVPLGYLGDAEKTARTFPTIDGCAGRSSGTRPGCWPTGRSNCSAAIR